MICTPRPDGWELLFQNAHGLLAMRLLAPWKAELRPVRWDEVLYATALHDNGWQEHEPGDRLTPLGTPRHFEETTAADVVRQSERALERVWHASVFAGLVLAEHFRVLYGAHPDAAVQAMLAAQRARGATARRRLGVKQAEVAAHYAPLRWADTLSLTLCLHRLRLFPNRRVELERIGRAPTFAWSRADGTIGLDPWPYAPASLTVKAYAYPLRQLTFEHDDALAAALAAPPPEVLTWTLRDAPFAP